MPGGTKQILRLFIASPSDVAEERDRVGVVVDGLNRTLEPDLGLRIELVKWETHAHPLMGRPEEVVLDGVRPQEWDIFVGILWLRFGTPTGEVRLPSAGPLLSGTEEEFEVAYRAWRETGRPVVMFYRCTSPPPNLLALDAEQYGRVTRFFRQFEHDSEHPGFVGSYSDAEQFERRFREDLTHIVRKIAPRGSSVFGLELNPTHRQRGFDKLFLPDYNEDRSAAKREALLQATEMRLIAYTGHAFLASIGHRYRNDLIARLDRGATFVAVLTNPWSERGFLISLAEGDRARHVALYKAYVSGDCASIDPVDIVQRSSWYLLKFLNSIEGSKRLIASYPGQVEIRFTDHEIPATVFLTETQGFFEPYLHVDSQVRLKRAMLTFEMQVSDSSDLFQHAKNLFEFLRDISEPFDTFLDSEQLHKKQLADTFRSRAATRG